jgi:circadian clock protein KaiC
MAVQQEKRDLMSTGIPGLNDVMGGLTPNRLYLVEGEPGSGKTTMALQFLMEGVRRGEKVIYITLSETAEEVRAIAASHGWDIEGITIHEVLPSESSLDPREQYTLFHPSEVELGATTQEILNIVEEAKPTRIALDSLSELQLLAGNALRYRRQVLAFKQFFSSRAVTVLMLDDRTAPAGDLQIRSIAHGVVTLENSLKDYGTERRRLRITKYRGMSYRGGLHDYLIARGGLIVYPRLVAAESRVLSRREVLSSGLPELDLLLGGGLEEGSSTLLAGPPGTGKSSLSAQFAYAVLKKGQKAALFLFEESTNNLLNRSRGLGMDLHTPYESGQLTIRQVDPAELTPGEFAKAVVDAEQDGARVIVIDSLNGYLNATPDERFLTTHLHELLTYLGQRGVVTILVGVQRGIIGGGMTTSLDASYVADNVLMLRYFECDGEVRQAVSVIKKRGGHHERTIREFVMAPGGIRVGKVLRDFRGILTGVPVALGEQQRGVVANDQ